VITANELDAIVVKICSSMFDMDAVRSEPEGQEGGRRLASAVSFSGACQGAVVLSLSEALARLIAGQMYGLPLEELGETEIRDAVGELANMCCGSVKALLPGPNQLSMPSVSEGDHLSVCVPGAELLLEGAFGLTGQTLTVAILMKKTNP
jgi:chemotaxis protein CheX